MKIMLLAYEDDSYALCELARRLERDGHTAWIVNGDYFTFIDSQSVYNWYRSHGFTRWVNFEEEYRKLYTEDYAVDWGCLESFEKRSCVTKNLNQLIMTDPILGRSHHHRRPYMTPIECPDQLYYWVELLLRWCESLFKQIDPDLIFTIGQNYFIKNVIWQMANSQGIKMLNLIDSRVNGIYWISDNFGIGTSDTVRSFIASDKTDTRDLRPAMEYIERFRDTMLSTRGALVDTWLQSAWSELDPKVVLRRLAYTTRGIIVHGITRKKMYRGRFRSNYFNSSTLLTLLYSWRVAFNKLRFRWDNPCCSQLPSIPFIYMPLHVLPESSTLTLSTEYYEADLIRFIAKELLAGMCLVVKEHPHMVGIRPFSFYSNLADLLNVFLLDPRYPSKEVVEKSRGVTGISGTALFEAAMLQKPTHAFGEPEFLDILDFQGHAEFRDFVEHCAAGLPSRKFDQVLRYVKYMLDNGVELPLNDVLDKRGSQAFLEGVAIIHQMLKAKVGVSPGKHEYALRPYNLGDETSVLQLRDWYASPRAGYPKSPEEWEHQYIKNPCGIYIGTVVEDTNDSRIVGHAGLIPIPALWQGRKRRVGLISLVIAEPGVRGILLSDSNGRRLRLGYAALSECCIRADNDGIDAIFSYTSMNKAHLSSIGFKVMSAVRADRKLVLGWIPSMRRSHNYLRRVFAKQYRWLPRTVWKAIAVILGIWSHLRTQVKLHWSLAVASAQKIDVSSVDQFGEELESFWSELLHSVPPMITADRCAEVHNWRFSGEEYSKYIAREGEKVVGYCVARKMKDTDEGLILRLVDILALPTHEWAIQKMLQRCVADHDVVAIQYTSVISHPYSLWLDEQLDNLTLFDDGPTNMEFVVRASEMMLAEVEGADKTDLTDSKSWFITPLFFGNF